MAGDSADVWANREIFKLDSNLEASDLAGCPPDYFSPDGQLWGNPVYDWRKLKKEKYAWWIKRLNHSFKIYDIVRIDHFRGFESYYSIKAGSKPRVRVRGEKAAENHFLMLCLKSLMTE